MIAASFWLAFSVGALWGYIRVGKAVAITTGRRTYQRSHAYHRERWPILGERDAHRWGQDHAREAYVIARFLWPVSLVYLVATNGKGPELDFSPDGRVMQERISELERQLGMTRRLP